MLTCSNRGSPGFQAVLKESKWGGGVRISEGSATFEFYRMFSEGPRQGFFRSLEFSTCGWDFRISFGGDDHALLRASEKHEYNDDRDAAGEQEGDGDGGD